MSDDGLDIPAFLIISQKRRAQAWKQFKGFQPPAQPKPIKPVWKPLSTKEVRELRIEQLDLGL